MAELKMRSETAYLRRMTRAHAAGEMDTADYRRRRRAAIEACSNRVQDQDVTVPRSGWGGAAAHAHAGAEPGAETAAEAGAAIGADSGTGSKMTTSGVANQRYRRMTGGTRRRLLAMSVAGLVMLLIAWLW